jgi:hypothetical protein
LIQVGSFVSSFRPSAARAPPTDFLLMAADFSLPVTGVLFLIAIFQPV